MLFKGGPNFFFVKAANRLKTTEKGTRFIVWDLGTRYTHRQ